MCVCVTSSQHHPKPITQPFAASLRKLFCQADVNQNGTVELDEFIDFVMHGAPDDVVLTALERWEMVGILSDPISKGIGYIGHP